MRYFVLVLSLILSCPSGWAIESQSLVYDVVGDEVLRMDVSVPADSSKKHPAVMFIHGGCFLGGSRSDYSQAAQSMAQKGYVGIAVDYRLAPKNPYPAAITDVRMALRYLRAHADELGIDSQRIAVWGASAGGTLAVWLGAEPAYERGKQIEDSLSAPVAAVIDEYGRTDFTRSQGNTGYDCAEAFLQKKRSDDPLAFQEATVLNHLSACSAPMALFHGTADLQVAPVHSQLLYDRLKALGVQTQLEWIPGAGHGFGGADADRVWTLALQFLEKTFSRSVR